MGRCDGGRLMGQALWGRPGGAQREEAEAARSALVGRRLNDPKDRNRCVGEKGWPVLLFGRAGSFSHAEGTPRDPVASSSPRGCHDLRPTSQPVCPHPTLGSPAPNNPSEKSPRSLDPLTGQSLLSPGLAVTEILLPSSFGDPPHEKNTQP